MAILILDLVQQRQQLLKFSSANFIIHDERKPGAMRASRCRIPFHRPQPIVCDLRPNGPPYLGPPQSYSARRHGQTCAHLARVTYELSDFTCGFYVACAVNKKKIIFYLGAIWSEKTTPGISNFVQGRCLCFANSNALGCIRNVTCPVFIMDTSG